MIRLLLVSGAGILTLSSCGQAWAQPDPGHESPVEVLVAARDIAAGEVLKREDLSQRQVPGSLVTSSVVKASDASTIVNQRVSLPMLQGDPVNWSFFDVLYDQETMQACEKITVEPGGALEQVARARQRILAR